jgi:P4 family phage/plasmid primase-like protien
MAVGNEATYRVLAKLRNVKPLGPGRWSAQCPGHDDRENSLAVSVGDKSGLAVLHCHAKCDTIHVMQAGGILWSDLFPERKRDSAEAKSGPKRKVVAVYPYRDAAGSVIHETVRFDPKEFRQRRPEPSQPGKFLWNLNGIEPILYRLPELIASAGEDRLVVVVEGEKDSDRVASLGLITTTCPMGAGKWRPSYSEALRGRRVAILPDIDKQRPDGTSPGMDHATIVANALHGVAASVKVVHLPNEFDPPLTPKWDVSDWLDRGGTSEQFAAAVQAAPEWIANTQKSPLPPGGTITEADDDPHRLGRLYLEQAKHADGPTLRYWRESFYRWDGRTYNLLSLPEIRPEVTRTIKREFDRLHVEHAKTWVPHHDRERPPVAQKVTKTLVSNVLEAVAGMTLLSSRLEMPAWLPKLDANAAASNGHEQSSALPGPTRDFVVLQNGILDVPRLLAGQPDHLRPHSPIFFSTICLPFDFQEDADCQRWLTFLNRNLESDRDRIALLQEWFGYCLTFDTSYQKFLLLEGEGANGKSVVCAALTAVLGVDNVSHVPLEVFGKDFSLTQTLGRLANITSEVGELDRMAEGYLKSFTAGDRMTFNRKHQSLIEAAPSARLILATNNRPRFSDRSGGLWRRMLLLPLNVQITESERVHGMDHPEFWQDQGELPGIFNWSLVGLARLRQQRRFTIPGLCASAVEDYRSEVNPARRFLLEHFTPDPEGDVPKKEVYVSYRKWCDEVGCRPLADNIFGKEVKRVFPAIQYAKVWNFGGARCDGYRGICRIEPEGAAPDLCPDSGKTQEKNSQ